jgi:hypothetical protein
MNITLYIKQILLDLIMNYYAIIIIIKCLYCSDSGLKLYRSGDVLLGEAETKDIRMKVDHNGAIYITLEKSFSNGQLLGLCGNANGNPADDFEDTLNFGNSLKVNASVCRLVLFK